MSRQSKVTTQSSNRFPSRKAACSFIRFYGKFTSDQQTVFTVTERSKREVYLDAVCCHTASMTAWRAMDNLQMRITAWLDAYTLRLPPKRAKRTELPSEAEIIDNLAARAAQS